jgi:C4-dicarboxylate-specific signal transduction histidine kinase
MSDEYGAVDGMRQACHDIRQPIAGVLALAGAALAEAGLPGNARNRLEQIVGLAEWQSDVIEDWLRAFGPGPPGAGQADAVRVINEALAAERVTWAGELTFQWPAEPVFAPLHPVALRRVVANLLANATGAAGPAGRVRVEVGCRAGWMVVVVEDSGPGFGRVSGGSGLGLHAAARQAIRQGGRLECGRGRHGGGLVSLWLPLAPAQTGARAADATRSV